jgi:hypothetical protein
MTNQSSAIVITIPLAFVLASTTLAHADRGDKWDPTTVSVQSLAGTGAMIGVGGLIVWATSKKQCEGWDCYDFSPVFLAMAGGIAANVAATQLTGDALDGNLDRYGVRARRRDRFDRARGQASRGQPLRGVPRGVRPADHRGRRDRVSAER